MASGGPWPVGPKRSTRAWIDEQQEATRQLFLRLVTVGRDSETRRVVAASELITLDVDIVTMHGAVEAFVTNRLLVRDRDAAVGCAHVGGRPRGAAQ